MIKNWTATDESVVKPYTLAIKDEKCSLLLSNRFAVLGKIYETSHPLHGKVFITS